MSLITSVTNANETTSHQCQNEMDESNYRQPKGLQQLPRHVIMNNSIEKLNKNTSLIYYKTIYEKQIWQTLTNHNNWTKSCVDIWWLFMYRLA